MLIMTVGHGNRWEEMRRRGNCASETCSYEAFHPKMIKRGDFGGKNDELAASVSVTEGNDHRGSVKLWDGSNQPAGRDRATDATNHFLHVRCHGLDPAAQTVVLGDNPVVLQSEPCGGSNK